MGLFPYALHADGLVTEHRKYVDEGAISVAEQGGIKDRPQHDDVDSHASLVCDATVGKIAKNHIAKGQTHHGDKKCPKDKNRAFASNSCVAPAKPQDTEGQQTEPRSDKSTARSGKQDSDKDQEGTCEEGRPPLSSDLNNGGQLKPNGSMGYRHRMSI